MTSRVGITGHQARAEIDWDWTRKAVRFELAKCQPVSEAYSSLAKGSDQLFAKVALDLNINLVAVIPLRSYDDFFDPESLTEYRKLLVQSKRINLESIPDEERAFFVAGKYIADHCDTMFAIWDGLESKGLGGTEDIVAYTLSKRKPVIHINPIDLKVRRL